jgi:hypothetical protein
MGIEPTSEAWEVFTEPRADSMGPRLVRSKNRNEVRPKISGARPIVQSTSPAPGVSDWGRPTREPALLLPHLDFIGSKLAAMPVDFIER